MLSVSEILTRPDQTRPDNVIHLNRNSNFFCFISEFKDVQILTPEFNGSSFIKFPRLEGIKKKFSIEVSFMPKSSNGLILYNGQMKNGKGDFISLNLARGYVQFRFNLGSGIANIT